LALGRPASRVRVPPATVNRLNVELVVVAAAVLGGRPRAVWQGDRNCAWNPLGVFCRCEDADIICNCVSVSSVRHLLARRYSRWPNLERGESFGAAGFRYWLADPAADPTSSSRDDHIIACAHNRSAGDRSNGASDPSGCLDQRSFGSRDRALSEEFRSVESSEWVERHAR